MKRADIKHNYLTRRQQKAIVLVVSICTVQEDNFRMTEKIDVQFDVNRNKYTLWQVVGSGLVAAVVYLIVINDISQD